MIVVNVLGRFEVLSAGRAVSPATWQSRKARDVLRILVARRGRAIPRGELAQLLWPDGTPSRMSPRLSSQLSILRAALADSRPAPAGDALVVDRASVRLDLSRIRVDVEEFLVGVDAALHLHDRGDVARAGALLAEMEASYRGDAFADEPYADWCRPIREEARAAYLRALRALAGLAGTAGDMDRAVYYLLRLLANDPYDEDAHHRLVRALACVRRHGEARRAFARYAAAMRDIDVEPPDPAILSAQPAPVRGAG